MLKANPAAHFALLLIISCSLVAGCATNGPAPTVEKIEGSPTAESTDSASGDSSDPAATELFSDQASEETPANTIDDDLALTYMYDLIGPSQQRADDALQAVTSAGDQRFIAVLIELLRGFQIGLVTHNLDISGAIEQLSGQAYGADWPEWVAWYGATSLLPPPGFSVTTSP